MAGGRASLWPVPVKPLPLADRNPEAMEIKAFGGTIQFIDNHTHKKIGLTAGSDKNSARSLIIL
jgi:hypothetical protein